MEKITKATKVNEMIKQYAVTVEILKQYGLECLGCIGAEKESLQLACNSHGINPDQFIRDLNKAVACHPE